MPDVVGIRPRWPCDLPPSFQLRSDMLTTGVSALVCPRTQYWWLYAWRDVISWRSEGINK